MVTIQLTDKQAKFMLESLREYRDCGVPYSCWASDKLIELRDIVDKAIESSAICDSNHDDQ